MVRTYKISLSDNYFNGITRFISKHTKTKDIYRNHFIDISYDSLASYASVTAPIGFVEPEKESYFNSLSDHQEHWYQIDFFSFHPEINAFTTSMRSAHYREHMYLMAGNDEHSLTIVHDENMKRGTESNHAFILKTPVSARFFRIFVNTSRFDNLWDLSIADLEFFGKFQWPSCETLPVSLNIRLFFHFLIVFSIKI